MNLPSSSEFDIFLEDDGFELDFELNPESSMMWPDDVDSSSSLVDESQDFFNTDSDFDLLDDTESSPPVEDSHNSFKMDLDHKTMSHSDGSDSEMSVDSEFDTFSLPTLLEQRMLIPVDEIH